MGFQQQQQQPQQQNFRNVVFSSYLELQTRDEVHKASDSGVLSCLFEKKF
jgi:hypothetical protein